MATPARFCCLCGQPAAEVGRISSRGRCGACADRAMVENMLGIAARRGPYFERWLLGRVHAVNRDFALYQAPAGELELAPIQAI